MARKTLKDIAGNTIEIAKENIVPSGIDVSEFANASTDPEKKLATEKVVTDAISTVVPKFSTQQSFVVYGQNQDSIFPVTYDINNVGSSLIQRDANGNINVSTIHMAKTNLWIDTDGTDALTYGRKTLNTDSDFSLVTKSYADTKVDKVTGKGLSTNDFTNTDKSKLEGISANATKVQDNHIVANGTILIDATQTIVYDDSEVRGLIAGKTTGYVINSQSDIEGTVVTKGYKNVTRIGTIVLSTLKIGDDIYIRDENVPDYWVSNVSGEDGICLTELKTKIDLTNYYTKSEVNGLLASKQDTISDLSTIRSGASAGATAVQPATLNNYATTTALTNGLATKQDTISDLGTIRNGASLGSTAVQKANVTAGQYKVYGNNEGVETTIDYNSNPVSWNLAQYGNDAKLRSTNPTSEDEWAGSNVVTTISYVQGKVDALNTTIGLKADATALTSHTSNSTIHVTSTEKNTWNGKQNSFTVGTGLEMVNGVLNCTISPTGSYLENTANNGVKLTNSNNTIVSDRTCAFGVGLVDNSNCWSQTVVGTFNSADQFAKFIVGGGSGDSTRSNALTVYGNGHATLGDSDIDDNVKSIVTKGYADSTFLKPISDQDIQVKSVTLTNNYSSNAKISYTIGGGLVLYVDDGSSTPATTYILSPTVFRSNESNKCDLGSYNQYSDNRWKNIYASGVLSDGTNSKSITDIVTASSGSKLYLHSINIHETDLNHTAYIYYKSTSPTAYTFQTFLAEMGKALGTFALLDDTSNNFGAVNYITSSQFNVMSTDNTGSTMQVTFGSGFIDTFTDTVTEL